MFTLAVGCDVVTRTIGHPWLWLQQVTTAFFDAPGVYELRLTADDTELTAFDDVTVTVTPAANQSGSATITLTVSDGALTASTSFLLTVNALTASDQVIVPVQCEYLSLRGLAQLQNTLELIRDEARRVHELFGGRELFLSHDEIRVFNQDEACRRRDLDAFLERHTQSGTRPSSV